MTDTLARVRSLIGTAAEWVADPLVLGKGELAIEMKGGVPRIRVGDGIKRFDQLKNAFISSQGDNIDGPLVWGGRAVEYRINTTQSIFGTVLEIKATRQTGTSPSTVHIGAIDAGGTEQLLKWTGNADLVLPNPSTAEHVAIGCNTFYGNNTMWFAPADNEGFTQAAANFVFQCDIPKNINVVLDVNGRITCSAPNLDTHAATKKYVDDQVGGIVVPGGGLTEPAANLLYLRRDGGNMMGSDIQFNKATSNYKVGTRNTVFGTVMDISPATPTGGISSVHIGASDGTSNHDLVWNGKNADLILPNPATAQVMALGCASLYGANTLWFSPADADGLQVGVGAYVFQCDVPNNINVVIDTTGHISCADPNTAGQAATKRYVDAEIAKGASTSSITKAQADGWYVPRDGSRNLTAGKLRFDTAGGKAYDIQTSHNIFGSNFKIKAIDDLGATSITLSSTGRTAAGDDEEHPLLWSSQAELILPNPDNTEAMAIGCVDFLGQNTLEFAHAKAGGLDPNGVGAYVFQQGSGEFCSMSQGQIATTATAPTAASHLTRKDYVDRKTWAASAITSGTLAVARLPRGTTSTTVATGDHNHNMQYVRIGDPSLANQPNQNVLGTIRANQLAASNIVNATTLTTFLGVIVPGSASDRALKENIKPVTYGLTEVMSLAPSTFDFKTMAGGGKNNYGFVAQDLQRVMPDLVHSIDLPTNAPGADPSLPSNVLGYEPFYLIPVLTKAIQELKAEFDTYVAAHP